MKKTLGATIVSLLCLITSFTAQADVSLVGSWSGKVNAVVINAPMSEQGMPQNYYLGSRSTRKDRRPNFFEDAAAFSIEQQQGDLLAGQFTVRDDKGVSKGAGSFVCTQVVSGRWNCVGNGGGVGTMEVLSANQVKLCYLRSGESGESAGCGSFSRAK